MKLAVGSYLVCYLIMTVIYLFYANAWGFSLSSNSSELVIYRIIVSAISVVPLIFYFWFTKKGYKIPLHFLSIITFISTILLYVLLGISYLSYWGHYGETKDFVEFVSKNNTLSTVVLMLNIFPLVALGWLSLVNKISYNRSLFKLAIITINWFVALIISIGFLIITTYSFLNINI